MSLTPPKSFISLGVLEKFKMATTCRMRDGGGLMLDKNCRIKNLVTPVPVILWYFDDPSPTPIGFGMKKSEKEKKLYCHASKLLQYEISDRWVDITKAMKSYVGCHQYQ
jgi:hypothetical protein